MKGVIGKGITLAALIAVAAAAVALGSANPGSQSSTGTPAKTESDLRTAAHEVFDAFNGTVAERTSGALLQAHALNAGMDACMAEHGYPEWDWSAARNYAPPVDPLGVSTFFAEPLGTPVSDSAMATKPRQESEERLMAEEPTGAGARAVTECVTATPEVSDDEADAAGRPPDAARLREAWWSMLSALDAQYGDEKAYVECLAEADLSLNIDPAMGKEGVAEALSALVPAAADIPEPGASDRPSAAWSRLLAAEQEADAADWSCRRDVYSSHRGDVADAIAAFAQDHADEIAAAHEGWAKIVAQARSLTTS